MEQFTLHNVEARFPYLTHPYRPRYGLPKYTCSFYVERGSRNMSLITNAIHNAAETEWPYTYEDKLQQAKLGPYGYPIVYADRNKDPKSNGRVLVKSSAPFSNPPRLLDKHGNPSTEGFTDGSIIDVKLQVMATLPDALKSSPDVWSPIIRLIITEAQTV